MTRTGRPRLPDEQRRSEVLRLRMTPGELAEVHAAGDAEWQREVLLRAARRAAKRQTPGRK